MDILKLIFGEGSPDCAYSGRDLKCPKKRADCHAWEAKIKQNPNVPEDIYLDGCVPLQMYKEEAN